MYRRYHIITVGQPQVFVETVLQGQVRWFGGPQVPFAETGGLVYPFQPLRQGLFFGMDTPF